MSSVKRRRPKGMRPRRFFASYSFERGGVLNTVTARLDNAADTLYRNHLNYLKDVPAGNRAQLQSRLRDGILMARRAIGRVERRSTRLTVRRRLRDVRGDEMRSRSPIDRAVALLIASSDRVMCRPQRWLSGCAPRGLTRGDRSRSSLHRTRPAACEGFDGLRLARARRTRPRPAIPAGKRSPPPTPFPRPSAS